MIQLKGFVMGCKALRRHLHNGREGRDEITGACVHTHLYIDRQFLTSGKINHTEKEK